MFPIFRNLLTQNAARKSYNAGVAMVRAGDLQRAFDHYMALVEKEPSNVDARRQVIFLARRLHIDDKDLKLPWPNIVNRP